MGYTHYWYRVKNLPVYEFDQFTGACKNIIAQSGVNICNWEGIGEPEIDADLVAFNGNASSEMDHESFVIERNYIVDKYSMKNEDGLYFAFCKTARKPYDVVVTACLIAARYYFCENIQIKSDGSFTEWKDGIKLASQVLGDISNVETYLKESLRD
jgi:hypothetical protein